MDDSRIDILPHDIYFIIFSYLSPQQLIHVAGVCKKWREIIFENWEKLVKEDASLDSRFQFLGRKGISFFESWLERCRFTRMVKEIVQGNSKKKPRLPIQFINNKTKRQQVFSRKKLAIMQETYDLVNSTGAEAIFITATSAGNVYTFGTPKFQKIVTTDAFKHEFKSLMQESKEEEIIH